MRRLLLLGLCFFGFSGLRFTRAAAQDVAPTLSTVQPGNVAKLLTAGKVSSETPLEIDVTGAQLQVARAVEPLQTWVQGGGIVPLHTDVARLFGFQTVAPRQRTPNRAGQRWGRASNALPFGAHPLLWGGASTDENSMGLPGVKV